MTAHASQLAAETSRPVKEDLRPRITWTAVSLVAFLVCSAELTPWLQGGSLLIGGPRPQTRADALLALPPL